MGVVKGNEIRRFYCCTTGVPPIMHAIGNQVERGAANASHEVLLLETIKRLERNPGERLAVHLNLSKLRARYRQSHHLRIAHNTFEDLVRNLDGQVFLLSNGDIIFLHVSGNLEPVDEAVLRVRHLFSDDPLVQIDDAPASTEFCTWYDLSQDFDRFARLGGDLLAQYKLRRHRGAGDKEKAALKPMTPALLAEIEAALAQADLSSLTRQQSICAIKDGAAPVAVMKEFYVSIRDLQGLIAKGVDLTSDRWLFQRLTQTLDRRVLSQFSRLDSSDTWRYFSLNLNVATLLSPEFLKFDASLRSGARGTIVVELPPADVFGDMPAFVFARDFAQARGYRICLDGLTILTAPLINRGQLGVDLLKLYWDAEMADDPTESRKQDLEEFVKKTGPARVILARCDNQDAVDFGVSLGISMFQGRHIDRLLAKKK